ncbi:PLP-dependent lyase/thiolase [Arthrobacter sp. SW1]|uniref:diaminopropionate ammonia-lyase n=1 Tax=Arthrobacter sp. SW1 TaxID=1920889 RepID=UPI000877C3A2|nr:diaminopropionate ammonia-lyase [Arthrobacter sp. SW1]OFI39519.1 PLP-dependent lyase/thiolase [Arthrobacter sp. SW1]
MPSTNTAFWYANPAARQWQTPAPASALSFHQTLEGYAPTPLTSLPSIAAELGVGKVFLKNESDRLGLPAFKILGASWATCRVLCERFGLDIASVTVDQLQDFLATLEASARPVLVTATDGNHGRAVSRMARLLGIRSRIYIPNGLSAAAIDGIKGEGAELVPLDATYDEVVEAASVSVADSETDLLVQDTSWPGYTDIPRWIVDGYTTLFAEVDDALAALGSERPSLVACPVGVGSLALALVDHYRSPAALGSPSLLSVEPQTAACIVQSLLAGEPVTVDTSFPSIMSGLNCGTPSELGWPSLRSGLDAAVSVTEEECRQAVLDLSALGQDAGPCGAATLAGVRNALADEGRRRQLGIGPDSVVVLVSTEGLAANPLR